MAIEVGPSKGFLDKMKSSKSKKPAGKKQDMKKKAKGSSRLAEVFKSMHE